ncbi:Gfo/Idh/MocA family oxidoreductase [Aquirufa antheringensis]
MYKVAIIGSGQLGSRHLQGLLKIDLPLTIYVVDASQESLELAKIRATEIGGILNNIHYLTSIDGLSDSIDLCIIATGANVRLLVLKELLGLKKVKNIVLEKVLFQNIDEYQVASALIKKYEVNCWVNCPRPMFDIYKYIKSKISREELTTYSVFGGEWGLACNAIHFIDNMAFITQNSEFSYDYTGITSIIESKRKGYIEFTGTYICRNSIGSELILHSHKSNNSNLRIQILTENFAWAINEVEGVMIESSKKENWQENSQSIKIPVQSDLSNIFAKKILLEGKSDLTSYSESMKLHVGMLSSFIDLYNFKTNQNLKYCPIT